jgi:putative ABC transport system permease protein
MSPLAFAWRSWTRQPGRAVLGTTGIAVVGALLLDMLLLSRGLAVSFRDLLDGVGYDVRVTAGSWVPTRGAAMAEGRAALGRVRALAAVEDAVGVRFGEASIAGLGGDGPLVNFMGLSGPARRVFTVLEGEELAWPERAGTPEILVNRALADRAGLAPGDRLRLRGACVPGPSARPAVEFQVAGIVEFRFEAEGSLDSVVHLGHLLAVCEPADADALSLLLVASRPPGGPAAAVAGIREALPDLHVYTNQEFVDRMRVTDFSYFRQISFALSTITLLFAFLLIAALLTVSVNRRLAEVAALRALGFPRRRVVAELLWESALFVGVGGVIALPLGGLFALWLDAILREMPGIPRGLHFFVFEPRAALTYGALLALTGLSAAAYPVYLGARLPIAATLRREVVS